MIDYGHNPEPGRDECEFCGVSLEACIRYQIVQSDSGYTRMLYVCGDCFRFWDAGEELDEITAAECFYEEEARRAEQDGDHGRAKEIRAEKMLLNTPRRRAHD